MPCSNAHDARFSGQLPVQLASLTTLQHFTAGSNQISGSLHPEFAAWRKLTFLHIGKLRGYQFKWLTADCSGNNSLSGSSSRGFGNWSAVQTLSIYGNPLVLLPISRRLCTSSPNVSTAVCLIHHSSIHWYSLHFDFSERA